MADNLLNPYAAELMDLSQQQKLAQMLTQQGLQAPQGQMVSGQYVKSSPLQYLANMANTYVGQKTAEEATNKEKALANLIRQESATDTQNILGKLYGTQARSEEQAGPAYQGVKPSIEYAAQPGSPMAAYAEALRGRSPAAQGMAQILQKQMLEPKWEKSERVVDGVRQTGYVNLNASNPVDTFRLAGTSPDIETAKGVYEGYLTPNGSVPLAQNNQVPLNIRNNNPGNLVGANGQFLTFATPQEGDMALTKDLSMKLSGQSPAYKARFGNAPVTPMSLAETWSPANAKGNSPESTTNYAKFIANKLGIAPNAPIPNSPDALNLVKSAITQFESGVYGSTQGNQMSSADSKFMPTNLPQYQYDPSISPKENAALATKFSQENQSAIKNAKNSFDVLKNASDILNTNTPSSGRGENIITGAREFFGGGGATSKADAQLKIFGSKLTMQVPRFEGPQSDKDTAIYQAAAGDVGNPNIPIGSRLAAIETMKEVAKKYYPNGDWDSIDTGGAVVKKNFLGGTRALGAETLTPQQFVQGLNPEDKEAFNWARKNPNDPRALQINKRLGID